MQGAPTVASSEPLMTVAALAARLCYTPAFLYKLRCVAPDRLPPPLDMPGRPRWSASAVEEWIAERTVRAAAASGRRGPKSTAAKARAAAEQHAGAAQ